MTLYTVSTSFVPPSTLIFSIGTQRAVFLKLPLFRSVSFDSNSSSNAATTDNLVAIANVAAGTYT